MSQDYEVLVQKVYEAVLSDGDLAIDVGAHIGRHTIPMATKVGATGRVVAFEPLNDCREQLAFELGRHPLPIKRRVALYPWALGWRPAEADFVVALDCPGYSGLRKRIYDAPTRIMTRRVRVETLDRLFTPLSQAWWWNLRRSLRFIKIDVEGGEYHILLGAERTLRAERPVIVFECGANSIGEYDFEPEDLFSYLRSLDYLVLDVFGRTIEDEARFASSARLQELWDYVAVPSEDHAAHSAIMEALRRNGTR